MFFFKILYYENNCSKGSKYFLKRTIKQPKKQDHRSQGKGGCFELGWKVSFSIFLRRLNKSILKPQHEENTVENCWNRRFRVSMIAKCSLLPTMVGANVRTFFTCAFLSSFCSLSLFKNWFGGHEKCFFLFRSLPICFSDRFPKFYHWNFPFFCPKNRKNSIKAHILYKICLLYEKFIPLAKIKNISPVFLSRKIIRSFLSQDKIRKL